ncbi:MAG TPA: DUF542 domain-containing protein [Dehalococcoidia bacterium]|nr:DUF542 domain-containing protein [Dehalococcoidia bacterium]
MTGGETSITPSMTVGDLLHHYPSAEEVLRRHGVDLCCGQALALQQAVAVAGAELEGLLSELKAALQEET